MGYQDFKSAPSSDKLEQLAALAALQFERQAQVEALAEDLKAAQRLLSEVRDRDIPDLLEELELAEFTTADGLKIKLEKKVACKLSQGKRAAAIKWLEDNGHQGVIRTEVTASYGREDKATADALLAELRGEGVTAKLDASVHSSTLTSLLNGLDADGVDFPMDVFGAHRVRRAKLEQK